MMYLSREDFEQCAQENDREANRFDATPALDAQGNPGLALQLVEPTYDVTQPPPGSWAETARLMSQMFPNDDIDWDAWKDEMKESDVA